MNGSKITVKKRGGTITSLSTGGAPTPPLMIGDALCVVGIKTALHAKR
jgi:hypothetical protein